MDRATDRATLDDLTAHLAADEATGFELFRELFFTALDHRLLDQCRLLLDVLAAAPMLALQQAARHYRAILLFEQHQYDKAETGLRGLLQEELSLLQRARSLTELANLLNEQGQWQEAERYYQ